MCKNARPDNQLDATTAAAAGDNGSSEIRRQPLPFRPHDGFRPRQNYPQQLW